MVLRTLAKSSLPTCVNKCINNCTQRVISTKLTPFVRHKQHDTANVLTKAKSPSNFKFRHLTMLIFTRSYASGKQESYFSAIGGDSDKPPPDLTPSQVTNTIYCNY